MAGGGLKQLVLPGGGTAEKLFAVLRQPAALALKEGATPPEVAGENPVTVEHVRELEFVEAAALIEAEENRRTLPLVPIDAAGVMRARHHAIARMLASGAKHTEVGRAIGVSTASINLLLRAPAFQALLLEYMNMMDKSAITTQNKLQVLNGLGVDHLIDKLLNAPDAVKVSEALEIVKVTSDRTGNGPTSKNITLNGRLTPADIRALKDAAETSSPVWVEGSEVIEGLAVSSSEGEQSAGEAGSGVREEGGDRPQTVDDLANIVSSLDEIFRPTR